MMARAYAMTSKVQAVAVECRAWCSRNPCVLRASRCLRPVARGTRMEGPPASGFSLLELIVALAMMAVLAAYGVPTYVAYAARGHRVDAVVALHQAAQHVSAIAADPTARRALPADLARTPAHGRAVYRLELVWFNDRGGNYEIQAIPVEGGPMAGDACGTYVLDGLGARSNRMARTESANAHACWLGRPP